MDKFLQKRSACKDVYITLKEIIEIMIEHIQDEDDKDKIISIQRKVQACIGIPETVVSEFASRLIPFQQHIISGNIKQALDENSSMEIVIDGKTLSGEDREQLMTKLLRYYNDTPENVRDLLLYKMRLALKYILAYQSLQDDC